MVTSVAYSIEQKPQPAQARAGGFEVHARFDAGTDAANASSAMTMTNDSQRGMRLVGACLTESDCRNQQYSITAVTTSAGAVTERYAYSAYGLPTILDASASVLSSSAISNRYTYTGREWDATLALHHFRARWVSPIAGRFLGRDPIGYRDGFSLYKNYMYLADVDPSGMKCCVHLWLPRTESEVGHAALKCSSNYFSFWPQSGCGLFGCAACIAHSEAQDEAAEGRKPDKIYCLDCDLDEQAIATKWNQVMNECRSGVRKFCTLGGNCSSNVCRLLKAGVPRGCDEKCQPPAYFTGCMDKCGGGLDEGCPGIDRPETAGGYFHCLNESKCKPRVPDCRDTPRGWAGCPGHRW